MTPDDRAKLPPPPCCRLCCHIEKWIADGIERSQCLSGHPMQIGCTWQRERRLTAQERKDGVA